MNIIELLLRNPDSLTPQEQIELTQELSIAYKTDEAANTSPEVHRIAEKIRQRLHEQVDRKDAENNT